MDTKANQSSSLGRIVIVVLLLSVLIGIYFGPAPGFLSSRMDQQPGVIALLFGFLISFTIIILMALRLDGRSFGELGSWLRDQGLGKSTPWLPAVVGALVGIAWGMLTLSSYLQFDPQANLMEFSAFRLIAALLAVIGTIMEDILTRGYLMNRLSQIKVPGWAQILLSALVFAFYHTIWAFNIISFMFSVVYGLILAGLFLWGKRSLTPVILAHGLAVLIAEPFASMLLFLVPSL